MFKDMKSKLASAMSAMIQPIENVTYDLQTGSTGIKTSSGIVTYDGVELSKNPLDFFGMTIPAFAMLTPVDQVKQGDILVSDKKAYGFIQEITDSGSLRTLNVQGHSSRFVPTKVNMMGISKGVTIVKSFTNLFGGQDKAQGFDMNSLMMMSMMSGDKIDMEAMLPILMMSGGFGGSNTGGMNPLMMDDAHGGQKPFRLTQQESAPSDVVLKTEPVGLFASLRTYKDAATGSSNREILKSIINGINEAPEELEALKSFTAKKRSSVYSNLSVVGMKYRKHAEYLLSTKRVGTLVILVPEPANDFDEHAVAVYVTRTTGDRDGEYTWVKAGYIPKNESHLILDKTQIYEGHLLYKGDSHWSIDTTHIRVI